MAEKPSLPKGTRDLSPVEMARRGYMFSILREAFSRYGFSQIETPSFENLNTLMGKYGEEGDRLIFKILNSGDYLSKAPDELLQNKDSLHLTKHISEKALRYDLTVPFARYVVQHQNDITFPFKRFQMQPVWRADRPQKGRFREFYQCDADVVGSKSLWQEVELVQLYDDVFTKLGLNVSIKINNRKILSGLAEVTGQPELLIDMTVALDKLDKIGQDGVVEEMLSKGLTEHSVNVIRPFMQSMNQDEMWTLLDSTMKDSPVGQKGVEELKFIFSAVEAVGLKTAKLDLDLTLARGLNYYTGAIFEVKAHGVQIGSIGGGGRYDDLTGIFGMKNVSGVGVSFGLDRIYLALEELNLFSDDIDRGVEVLFVNMGAKEAMYTMKALSVLRSKGVKAEMYPDSTKLGKQMDYANKKNIPFVAIAGQTEMDNNIFTLKNMNTSEQISVSKDDIAEVIKK